MVARLLFAASVVFSLAFTTFTVASGGLAQTGAQEAERFGNLVRADFFAGLAGDRAAFERAMRLIEATLAENPRHAEALVWHGSGLLSRAGQAFQKADFPKGMELWERGLKEMDDAVTMQPENIGVLIARGASLLEASRQTPVPAQAKALLTTAAGDYEKVLALQAPYFAKLSVHARGELLFGLAEGLHRLGEKEKATSYFRRVVEETQGSEYESRARAWLAGTPPAVGAGGAACVGCHTK